MPPDAGGKFPRRSRTIESGVTRNMRHSKAVHVESHVVNAYIAHLPSAGYDMIPEADAGTKPGMSARYVVAN